MEKPSDCNIDEASNSQEASNTKMEKLLLKSSQSIVRKKRQTNTNHDVMISSENMSVLAFVKLIRYESRNMLPLMHTLWSTRRDVARLCIRMGRTLGCVCG